MPSPFLAFGHPGDAPTWTNADKDGVGTAYAGSSRVWYTLYHGALTEIYYPSVDLPQVRDWELAVTDGSTFLHSERKGMLASTSRRCPSLGYEITLTDAERRYSLEKTVIADPHLPCVLQNVRWRAQPSLKQTFKIYSVCNPHVDGRGSGNSGKVMTSSGRTILVANRGGRWLALGGNRSFARASVGYVGHSDGWSDLIDNFEMDWSFDYAEDGNIMLMSEIDFGETDEFTLGLAFGDSSHAAITTLLQSLATPFSDHLERFDAQWKRATTDRRPLDKFTFDDGNLYRSSFSLLLAHEDKTFQGATVASLSIPWGEARSDDDGVAGYHLIWTRDLVQTGTALLAAGQIPTPLRTLIYLAVAQLPDGSFSQNFWTDGRPYRDMIQLDEVAFPIHLARRLHLEKACNMFDPLPMVRKAARYLVLNGPITCQERWEEAAGYSPSTLAAIIAACICAASFAAESDDAEGSEFLLAYADWLRSHVVDWTVTETGTLVEKVPRHFVRLNPAHPGDAAERGAVDLKMICLTSQPPGRREEHPVRNIVDAGFLELVRHGIFAADDPLIVDSLRVIDATLKVETPSGPSWHRYNHDGYGQAAGGLPYTDHGIGRAWPLLTGERAHYELLAGRSAKPLVKAMEKFAGPTAMLPEQIWDERDIAATGLRFGCPTGSAAPLVWAHAEYIKLLRSIEQGKPYDQFEEVASRYRTPRRDTKIEFWTFAHPTKAVRVNQTLRICADQPFRLRYSLDRWTEFFNADSSETYGLHYVDVDVASTPRTTVAFTFFWPTQHRWDGCNFEVAVTAS